MRVCRTKSKGLRGLMWWVLLAGVAAGCDNSAPAPTKGGGTPGEQKKPAAVSVEPGKAVGGGASPAGPVAKPVTTITGNATKGKKVWASYGCATCHMLDGPSMAAPSLKGAWMTVRKLSDGREVIADVEYLKRSVMDPQADIVPGFPAPMTSFKGLMDDEQLDDLVAFIRSLSN